ncbi:MAG: right-handed parallel beta-helix repeat-containing protein, partial [Candidatus Lokiarchaeota archaeon]|nr:right-handed parallel beta-helix repeat-containing protein [Candidatus Lokiarchaeota archaeon]
DNEITRNDCSNNNGNGIYLSNNANHNLITMNDCYNNEGTGIVVETSNSNIINKNDCKENLAEGIALKTSNEHIITENECSENGGAGIYLETSNDNLITSNNCRENLDSGVLVEASYGNLITDNQCSGNLRPNIYLRYSNDNLITQNLCTGSPWGIVLRWSNNNEVTMNDCIENGEGIVIQEDATDNRITNNTCTNNYENGIILILNANYNTVSQNIFSENLLSGIWVASSSGTIIMKNDCSNNGESGISVTDLFGIGARDNILYGNNIENNINGIYFSEADNNHIFRNTIMGNDNGMVVEGQSELNLIYQNNFICNDVQALNEHAGLNNWHNIYMLEGNYWSDYTGTDSDGDGIGETPWPFPDFDAYPFIEINGWDVKTPLEEELLDVFYNPDFNRLGDYRTVHGNKTTYILAGMGNGFSEMIRDSYLPPYTMRLWFYGTEVFMQGSIWHFEEESAYGEPIWFCLFYLIIPPYYLYAAGLTPGWHEFQWELTFYTGGEQQTAYLTSYFYLV